MYLYKVVYKKENSCEMSHLRCETFLIVVLFSARYLVEIVALINALYWDKSLKLIFTFKVSLLKTEQIQDHLLANVISEDKGRFSAKDDRNTLKLALRKINQLLIPDFILVGKIYPCLGPSNEKFCLANVTFVCLTTDFASLICPSFGAFYVADFDTCL